MLKRMAKKSVINVIKSCINVNNTYMHGFLF